MQRLRLGIVGCGGISVAVARMAYWNAGFKLTACCDRNLEVAQAMASKYHAAQVTPDYHELVQNPEVDAVYFAVPHHLHYEMSKAALEAGKAVWCEKPITRTLAEGKQLAALAEQLGQKMAVNYQYRYDSAAYAMARAVQSGQLGKMNAVRINVPWLRTPNYFEKSPWHARQAQAGGGTLMTQGSHLIDLVIWALGEKPRSVMAYAGQRLFENVEVEDLVQGVCEMESGALVQINSTMAAVPEQSVTVEMYGSKGTVLYKSVPLPRVRFLGLTVKQERPPVGGGHAMIRSLNAFRAWVLEDLPYLCPAAEALPALAVVEAMYRSARTGQREAVEI